LISLFIAAIKNDPVPQQLSKIISFFFKSTKWQPPKTLNIKKHLKPLAKYTKI